MNRTTRRQPRVLAWFAIIVLLVQMSPVGAIASLAAPTDPGDPASTAQETPGSYLELHLMKCDPGATGTPQQLRDQCQRNGLVGTNLTITSVTDPAVVFTKTTVGTNTGYGVVNTGEIQPGDFKVDIQLPDDGSRFVVACRDVASQNDTPVTPTDAKAFTATVPDGVDVVCDVIVVPPADQNLPSITTTVWECSRADFPSSSRSREDLTQFCATHPATPRVLTIQGQSGTTSQTTTDPQTFKVTWQDLAAGTYKVSSDINTQTAGQYLQCTIDGGASWYEKTFDANNQTTFQDMDHEQAVCDLYIVNAPAPEATNTPIPPAEPTNTPAPTAAPTVMARVDVSVMTCAAGYDGGTDLASFNDSCATPMSGQLMELRPSAGDSAFLNTDANGNVSFTDVAPGTYKLTTGVPLDSATEYAYCSVDNGASWYPKELDMVGETVLNDIEQEQIQCRWFVVPKVEPTATATLKPVFPTATAIAPTATSVPATATATVAPTATATPQPLASILTHVLSCGEGVNTAGAAYNQLNRDCTTPVNDIKLRLTTANGLDVSGTTGMSGDGALRFYDLGQGDFTMTPSLPKTLTSTALFCRIGDGDIYQKSITNGSTVFLNLEGEQIDCQWFVQPIEPMPTVAPNQPTLTPQQGTGSITVREFLCAKSQSEITDWEKECQPGVTGSAYTVSMIDGNVSKTLSPNGQGVVTFEGLPAGKYELTQATGVWCKARAERVDSDSRLIVEPGLNTDVLLYQCNQAIGLPSTGVGADPMSSLTPIFGLIAVATALVAGTVMRAQRGRVRRVFAGRHTK